MGNCFVHGFNLILGALATGGNGNLFSNSVAPRGVAFTAMDLDTLLGSHVRYSATYVCSVQNFTYPGQRHNLLL